MANKKVLVLGAGIMASHMVPYLADQGYDVDVFTLLDTVSDRPNVKYFKQDAKDPATRRQYLANNYDCIVDYLQYSSQEAPFVLPEMLDHTGQYIFTSTGRIYDNLECPVRETSPRLLDSCKDPLLVNSDDSARLRTARDIADTLTELGVPCGTLEYSATTNPTYEVVLRAQNYDLYLGQTKLPPTMDLSEFFRPYGNLGWGGLTNFDIYDLNKEALANAGNYYNLHERVAESGYIVPILFGNFEVYATRGLFEGLDPSRDNVFHYTLGKTMKDIQIATEYD